MTLHPADHLIAEHAVIARLVDALDEYAGHLDNGGKFDRAIAGDFVAAITGYADGIHHRKEEDHLFPALRAAGGFAPEMAMREDHELGRELLGDMTFAIKSGERATAHELFSHAASRYVRMKRAHIDKENRTLFPAARASVTGPAAAAVVRAFRAVATEEQLKAWEQRIERLAARVHTAAAAGVTP